MRAELDTIDRSIAEKDGFLSKGFEKSEGPFVKALDTALASFNVERQAYYSGTFVGNHVHRCLQPKNIDTLCKAVVDTAEKLSPSLSPTAEKLSRQFTKVFTLFARCHNLYNLGRKLSGQELGMLDKNIQEFGAYYRETFPDATILPKIHMLEAHVVDWLKQWGAGLGLMGEQGAEGIHAAMNKIAPAFLNMPDRVQRLKCLLNEHHRQICPVLSELQPAPKRRKFKAKDQ